MSNIAVRLSNAETNCELLEIVKDIEAHTRDSPERSVSYAHCLGGLFSNSSSLVRKGSLNSAVIVIATTPGSWEDLIAAYRYAILSPDREVSQHAITFLPQFVAASLENADSLIKAALEAVTRHPASSSIHIHVSQAMEVVKNIGFFKLSSR
ncbi:unnamed protein product [Auanema sp. JU1783]|nr:unnamed protein product [Auanema sp. JU1783]